jgi:hypothetical protein
MTRRGAAACMRIMQVDGQREMRQSNGFRVLINITQVEDQLSAFASHSKGAAQSNEVKVSFEARILKSPSIGTTAPKAVIPRSFRMVHARLRLWDFSQGRRRI